MKKVLFTATVDSHIRQFHLPYLKMFKDMGYEVHVATNGNEEFENCDIKHIITFERNPFKINNLKAIKQLKEIIDKEKFDIIHCNTPMGGAVTRIAAKEARKKYGTKVFYTAHGFHFYKGAPLKNWIIYYPVEKWLAKYTDTIITINSEDYEIAKKKFKKTKNIELIHGVGLDTTRFDINITEEDKKKLRESLELKEEDIVLSYVAELNDNKNQILLINTVEKLIKENSNYKLLLIGDGENREKYKNEINNRNLNNNVKLLGKRIDVPQLLSITNIYLASSIREGLPVNVMEAMYVGLPIAAKSNRGHRELIIDNENGYIVDTNDPTKIKEKIELIANNENLRKKFIENSKEKVKKYEIKNVIEEMKKCYE